MTSYAFIQRDAGLEVVRLCAADSTPPMLCTSGERKTPATVVVGDVLKNGNGVLRVDAIQKS